MASSRDDFVIAIRSAFLKKSTQQKFSLLTLVFFSLFIVVLSSLDFKVIRYSKAVINELVYRSSFIVSVPENFIKETFIQVKDYTTFFNKYKKNVDELESLKSSYVSNEITEYENRELKELINDYVSSSDKILAKIIVDHDSPFLKSIIINKGSKDNIKIGTNIYDRSYLVGKVVEVNYKTSRVLLISDLNSNLPVSIVPGNIQAIVSGDSKNSGEIKYVKGNYLNDIDDKSIAYTSGTGSIYKSGIPVGRIQVFNNQNQKTLKVNFYSNFDQLKYVFAEVYIENSVVRDLNDEENDKSNSQIKDLKITDKLKLDLLNDQIEIYSKTNQKLLNENKELETKINDLDTQLLNLSNKIDAQKKIINQNEIDKDELKFLKLNLIYGKKCKKTFTNPKGFKFGTNEYKECVINKGKLPW